MAEFTPLATMIKAPQPFETIGPALNAANAAQNLQRGNIELQQADIKLRERKGIEELFRNRVGEFTDAQGNIDFNKLIPLGLSAAPTTFRDYVPQLAEGVQKASQAQESISKLTQDQQMALGRGLLSFTSDPKIDKVTAFLDDFAKQNPYAKDAVDFFKKYQLEPVKNDPEKIRQALISGSMRAMPQNEQRQLISPSIKPIDQGPQIPLLNENPYFGQGAGFVATLPKGLSPPEQAATITSPLTQAPVRAQVDPWNPGRVVGTQPFPEPSQAQGGAIPPTLNPPPGAKESIPDVISFRARINDYASNVYKERQAYRQIKALSSDELFNTSGTGAQKIASILSAVGIPVPSDYATNINKMAHYLAQVAVAKGDAMGVNTDKGRGQVEATSGNLTMTPAALKDIVNNNDAMAAGAEAFNKGMERAIANAGGNVLAARRFQNEWTKVFDPDVFRYASAKQEGDTKEIDTILGPKDSPQRARRAADLARRAEALKRLINEGR